MKSLDFRKVNGRLLAITKVERIRPDKPQEGNSDMSNYLRGSVIMSRFGPNEANMVIFE